MQILCFSHVFLWIIMIIIEKLQQLSRITMSFKMTLNYKFLCINFFVGEKIMKRWQKYFKIETLIHHPLIDSRFCWSALMNHTFCYLLFIQSEFPLWKVGERRRIGIGWRLMIFSLCFRIWMLNNDKNYFRTFNWSRYYFIRNTWMFLIWLPFQKLITS